MTRRLVIQPQAEMDVADAVVWYEDQRPALGNQLLDEIGSVMERVAHSPFQFPLRAGSCLERRTGRNPCAT